MDYLICTTENEPFTYNPGKNLLTDVEGKPVFEDPGKKWRLTNGEADKGKKKVKALKILLGLSCNWECQYCSQTENIPEKIIKPDIPAFLETLRTKDWNLEKIEFWGGEPLLFWSELAELIPQLWAMFPDAEMSMVTNGSLINKKKVDFLAKYGVHVVISHDGPGQPLRSGDPLYDPAKMKIIREMAEKNPIYKDGSLFNAVLTPENYDPVKIVDHLRRRVHPSVIVGFEGAASIHNRTANDESLRFDEETGQKMSGAIFLGLITGQLENTMLMSMVRLLVESMKMHRPAAAIQGKCGMNNEQYVACDLQGNVLFCHNTTEKIGHLNALEKADTSNMKPWLTRPVCKDCLVQQACKGGCMMVEPGDAWVASCNNNYHYHFGILLAAIFFATGKIPTNITKI